LAFSNLNPKYQRGNHYRYEYFRKHKGLFGRGIYFCPYCGRAMFNRKKIQIDHIRSIHRVQRSRSLQRKYGLYQNGVNDDSNLVASCYRCNGQKGSRGGLWVPLGEIGVFFVPFLRYTLFTIIWLGLISLYVYYHVEINGFIIQVIRSRYKYP